MARRTRGRKRAWYEDAARLRRFEAGAREVVSYRSGRQTKGTSAGLYYRFQLEVPGEGWRAVRIAFLRDSPAVVRATVEDDGPQDSPHRYRVRPADPGELCMWRRDAPRSERWVMADGLAELIGHTHAHLIREAWWRRTGEWPGPEAPHGDLSAHDKTQAA